MSSRKYDSFLDARYKGLYNTKPSAEVEVLRQARDEKMNAWRAHEVARVLVGGEQTTEEAQAAYAAGYAEGELFAAMNRDIVIADQVARKLRWSQ